MNSSSQQEEIAVLETQLVELDGPVDTLIVTKRAKARIRFNRFHARTSVLAPETLSLIFQYACGLPDIDDDEGKPVTISSVSVHWREVAQSTSSIWKKLCVNLKHPRHASAGAFSLIQLYYKHLGNQCIHLKLLLDEEHGSWEDDEGQVPNVPIQSVFQFILTDNPTKLGALLTNEFSLEWSELFVNSIHPDIGLPALNRIHIDWCEYPTPYYEASWYEKEYELKAALVPNLTFVTLGRAPPQFLIPHHQITDLRLENIPIDYCVDVINLCKNVSECYVYCPTLTSDRPLDPPTKQATFSRTTCLGWSFGIENWDFAFLKHYMFPALERFRCENQGDIGNYDELPEEEDARELQRQFLSRCPKLTVYERAAESFDNWEFNDLCDDLPDTIEELYIRQVTDQEAEICLQKLTRGEDSTMPIFPRLKILELEGGYNLAGRNFPKLIEMLESRRRPPPEEYKDQFLIEELGLKCEEGDGTSAQRQLTDDQAAQLQAFVNQGLKVVTSDVNGEDKVWTPVKP